MLQENNYENSSADLLGRQVVDEFIRRKGREKGRREEEPGSVEHGGRGRKNRVVDMNR